MITSKRTHIKNKQFHLVHLCNEKGEVPGSQFIRSYCVVCGEPIRIANDKDAKKICWGCHSEYQKQSRKDYITPRQRCKLGMTIS